MINTDEDALICDFAETYRIYNYKSLPCKLVGILACGMRNESRIIMKLSGSRMTTDQMLLASVVDNTRMIAWLQSDYGEKGINRPESITAQLLGETAESATISFDSGQDFDDEWRRLTGGAD